MSLPFCAFVCSVVSPSPSCPMLSRSFPPPSFIPVKEIFITDLTEALGAREDTCVDVAWVGHGAVTLGIHLSLPLLCDAPSLGSPSQLPWSE